MQKYSILKGFKKEFTHPQVYLLISVGTYERRMIDTVKIYVVLNEKTAMVLFPDLTGNIDLSFGFASNDAKFHEWCYDYPQCLWENALVSLTYPVLESHK